MSTTISACFCDGNIQNFGQPGCLTELGAPKALVIAQRKTSLGADNLIDLTSTLNSTYMDGFFLAEDSENRYIIIPDIKAYTPEQAEPVTDEASNGDIDNVRDGVSSMMFEFRGNDIYKAVSKWKGIDCLDLMAFLIDTNGNLLGKCEDSDMFGGLLIAKNSFVILPQPNNLEATNKYTVKFNLELGSGWDKVDYIGADDFTDYSLLTVEPLRDVNIKITATTTTTVDFKLDLDWGSAKNRSTAGVKGLTTADLNLRNVTDAADVVFASLVEPATPDGTYVGTFVAQDSTDVVYVQPILNVKEPLSLNRLSTVTTTIP